MTKARLDGLYLMLLGSLAFLLLGTVLAYTSGIEMVDFQCSLPGAMPDAPWRPLQRRRCCCVRPWRRQEIGQRMLRRRAR